MTDMEAEAAFRSVRWTGGAAICPHCECPTVYECRRPNGALRFRCKACRKDFSITSGTLFAFHKMPLRIYLAAIAIFLNEVKGKSALALCRDLDCQYKTAFVLAHKLREAMASEMKGMQVGGDGETVEVDGAYFGGYVKPANCKENRRDRRLAKNQNGKRQWWSWSASGVAAPCRPCSGPSRPRCRGSPRACRRIPTWWPTKPPHGMTCMAASRWTGSTTAPPTAIRASTPTAPSLLLPHAPGRDRPSPPRCRRVSGPLRAGGAWREDHRRVANGRQVQAVAALAMACRPSVDWCGYWQRAN